MSEPQIQGSAAGPVHNERQQDDGKDYYHQPEEEHDDSGDGVPGYCSRSSHGLQLPGTGRVIRNGRYSAMACMLCSRGRHDGGHPFVASIGLPNLITVRVFGSAARRSGPGWPY